MAKWTRATAFAVALIEILALAACIDTKLGRRQTSDFPRLPFAPASPSAPAPGPSLAMPTASGATVSLDGVWLSGCNLGTPAAPNGSLRQAFTILGSEISVYQETYENLTCSGVFAVRELTRDARLGEESVAKLAGEDVRVTRVEGTYLTLICQRCPSFPTTSQPFKQIFYVDDTLGTDRLHQGVLAIDGGTLNAEGYPTRLYDGFVERQ